MVDLDLLRKEPELFRLSLKNRFMEVGLVDEVLAADKVWRAATARADALRSERNQLSTTAQTAQAHGRRLKDIKRELEKLNEEEKLSAAKREKLLVRLPNLLADDVPVGEGETANKAVKTAGKIKLKNGKSHEELMTSLGWLDLLTAAKVSGARFRYLKNDAAIAWMKLSRLAFDFAVENGFTPVIPPVFTKEETLLGSGFFPEGQENTFKVEDSYLSGTSEPLLLALGANQVLAEDELPLRLVGFSACFRREAGSYGKDTRGMFRQHQFDKVELVSICKPEDSAKEHKFLLELEERFVAQFDVPYQVMLIGSGDLGAPAAKKYDIEAWFPSQERYRETHSVSNCTDYQARGLGIKYKDKNGDNQFAHTLNGTLATERLLLAIIENNQTEDGRVNLPSELSK
ncbi:MAG TPA: serine--tRNA ligase [Candidatus Saccharimonadales bacterium]|nr:serine--tRNA ligase [Candidatus Saccharimonadales bacterium]